MPPKGRRMLSYMHRRPFSEPTIHPSPSWPQDPLLPITMGLKISLPKCNGEIVPKGALTDQHQLAGSRSTPNFETEPHRDMEIGLIDPGPPRHLRSKIRPFACWTTHQPLHSSLPSYTRTSIRTSCCLSSRCMMN